MRQTAAVGLLFMLVATVGAAADPRAIEGIAYVEGAAEEIDVQVWALGEQVAARSEWQYEAVFAGTVIPGKAFAIDLGEARLPVRVELAAEGHAAVALDVVFPEQLALPAAWLRTGETLTISLGPLPDPDDRAVVWGDVMADFAFRDRRRWQPAIAHRDVEPGTSFVAVVPPGAMACVVHGIHPDGHFGTAEVRMVGQVASARLDLATVEVAVKVWDHRGRPVPGVRMAAAESPFEIAATTDDAGRTSVRVHEDGKWKIQALDERWMGVAVGRGRPEGELAIDLVPRSDLLLSWDESAGPLAIEPSWLARSLGGSARVHEGGRARLPMLEQRGRCDYWSPGVVQGMSVYEDGVDSLVLKTRTPARLDGRVIMSDGEPAPGIPVWVRFERDALSPYRGMVAPRGGERPLARPWLPWAVTELDGRFSVGGLAPSDLQAEALAPGFPTARGERATGAEGQALSTTVVIRAGAALTLRVTDPGGAPLPAATVDVYRSRESRRPRSGEMRVARSGDRGDPELTGATDEDGRVVLQQVPVGLVRLRLSRQGSVTRTFDGITVPEAGADLGDLVLEPGVTLRGTTVGPKGEPVASAEVAIGTDVRMPYFRPDTTSDAEGRFSVPDLAGSGTLYLQAQAEGYVPAAPLEVRMPPEGEVEVEMATARTLEGLVVDVRDEAPIADAEIVLAEYQARAFGGTVVPVPRPVGRATSDSEGRFVVEDLAGGARLELTARAGGRQAAKREVLVPGDADPEPLVVRLEPGLELSGRVLDEDGEPASGVQVAAGPPAQSLQTSLSGPHSTTRADAVGRFTFDDLAAGAVEVVARSEDGRTARSTAEAGSGEEVLLRFERGLTLDGVVLDPEGVPVAGASVGAGGECTDRYQGSVTGEDGRFELTGIRRGRCTLFARAEGHAVAEREVEVPDGGLRGLELRLEHGATVAGRVVGIGSSELERCRIWSDDGASTQPGVDGRFLLSGVGAGEREITAQLLGSDRTRSVRAVVPESGESDPVVIDFESGLTLLGRVLRRGTGAPGLTVSAASVATQTVGSGISAADGGWRIEGLDPGEYQVAARNRSGEVVAGDHVLVETDTELELRIEGGRISGRVVEADSEAPIAGATVTISGSGLPPVDRRTTTDASGFFETLDLGDGDYSVRASAPQRAPEQTLVTVRDGLAGEVRLALERERRTVFVVRGPDGNAPSEVWIASAAGGMLGPLVHVSCAAGGRCEVSEFPSGRWTVLIASGRSAAALMVADLPRDEVPVTLRRSGELELRAGADETGASWQVRISEAATGIVLPVSQWRNPGRGEWVPVPASGLSLLLPHGRWRVEAFAPDGTTSVREADVAAGAATQVVLE